MNRTIGLADGHEWEGGAPPPKTASPATPTIPTEEVLPRLIAAV
jgi:hypothetical protein